MISNRPLKRVLELQPLSHDHHHGLQLCWKIRTGFSKQVEVERIKKYADWFYRNHLVPHFELEEKYIFTILDKKNELVKQALTDHRRLKRLFTQTTNLEKSLGLIEEELEKHIRFEERVLFPEVQKEAAPEQLLKLQKFMIMNFLLKITMTLFGHNKSIFSKKNIFFKQVNYFCSIRKQLIMFSKTCEYGIRATIFIASQSYQNNRVGLKDIAKKIDSPEAFTAKILQILSKNSIINSVKGVGGGFEISKLVMSKITLAQIVTALDGDRVFTGCGLGLNYCSEDHPCPVHEKFKSIRNELAFMLENTNLEELAMGIKSGDTFLRY